MATANLIGPGRPPEPSADDSAGLQARLAQIVGVPFRFIRFSYGDELVLHFGNLRPGGWPKVKDMLFGSYILGAVASPWVLKSSSGQMILTEEVNFNRGPHESDSRLTKREIEANPLITPESRVLSAAAFPIVPANAYGLEVRFSDGGSLLILPPSPEPDDPADAHLPEVPDWELLTPGGCLEAGPGLAWSFEPAADTAHGEKE